MTSEEGVPKDAPSGNQSEAARKNGRRELSLRDQVLIVLTHPGVVTALVTAIFGSLAVAVATNWVTKALGERELQFKDVEALIEYTKVSDLNKVPAISKLEALTRLIGDNEQFSVRVDGFQALVRDFRQDELRETRQKVSALEAEKAELEKKRDQKAGSESQDRKKLEQEIRTKENAIIQTRAREKDLEGRLAASTRSQGQLANELERKNKEPGAEKLHSRDCTGGGAG